MEKEGLITLDASGWLTRFDPYKAFKLSLHSPDWHGENINALIDSIVYGGINLTELPFRIAIKNTQSLGPDVKDELSNIVSALLEASEEHGNRDKIDIELM